MRLLFHAVLMMCYSILNQHQNHCDEWIKLVNHYKELQQTSWKTFIVIKRITWCQKQKNVKNITKALNHVLHQQNVNSMCRDFEIWVIWNNFINFSMRYQNHPVIWKKRKTWSWSHIYKTFCADAYTLICVNKQNYSMIRNYKKVIASNICMMSSMKCKNHQLKAQKTWNHVYKLFWLCRVLSFWSASESL